jgi:hypothetical protein
MKVKAQADVAGALLKLERVGGSSRVVLEKVFRTDAKGFVRDVIAITPPNTGKTNTESKKRGERAVSADLRGGRRSAGRQGGGIITPLADSIIDSALATGIYQSENVRLFVKKDGTIYGTDRSLFRPDATVETLHSHHKRYFKNGRMTSAGGRDRTIGRWKFIDKLVVRQSAFNAYLKEVYAKVGGLCAGFNAAARVLGVSVPAWIRRHGEGWSTVVVVSTSKNWLVRITNKSKFGSTVDLQRRMDYVLQSGKRKKRLANAFKFALKDEMKRFTR